MSLEWKMVDQNQAFKDTAPYSNQTEYIGAVLGTY
jgi:hypothetical protein